MSRHLNSSDDMFGLAPGEALGMSHVWPGCCGWTDVAAEPCGECMDVLRERRVFGSASSYVVQALILFLVAAVALLIGFNLGLDEAQAARRDGCG